jgi:hypothetical protein
MIFDACPFHQLPPEGSGRPLSGLKKFGYIITLHVAHAINSVKATRKKVWRREPGA